MGDLCGRDSRGVGRGAAPMGRPRSPGADRDPEVPPLPAAVLASDGRHGRRSSLAGLWSGELQGVLRARYKLPEASEVVSDPHNFLLEVAATAGLPALVLFAAIAVLGAVDVRRAKRADRKTLTLDAGNHADHNGAGRPAVVPVYAGLAVGTVLAIPAGWAGGETLDLAIVWLTLPVMGLIVWLLHPWVRGGTLSIGQVAIAMAALLINLLAAGGIGFPGLGQNVWILAAIVLNLAESPLNEARGALVRRKLMKVGGFAAALLLAGACYVTMYRPVLAARGHLADARLRTWDRQLQETELWAAAAADRWWARPCEDLAMLAVAGWTEEPSARGLDAFEAAMAESLDRDRDSNRLHWLHGDGLLRMFEQDRQPLLRHPRRPGLSAGCGSLSQQQLFARATGLGLAPHRQPPARAKRLKRRCVWTASPPTKN